MKKILMTIMFCTAFVFAGNFIKPDESTVEDSPDTVYVEKSYVVYAPVYRPYRPSSRTYYRHAPDHCINKNCLHRHPSYRHYPRPPRPLQPSPHPHGHRPPPPPPPKHHDHR